MSFSESYGCLPDEEEQDVLYGESFVQATYSPPNLSEKLYKDDLVGYHTVSISRGDLTRVWIVGINGHRFHGRLLKWVESTEREQPDLIAPWQAEWRKLKGELQDVRVQWKLLFKEVDVAMSLLEKHEIFSITPNLWSWRINRDITRLRQNQILKPDTPGYQQDFLDLAEAIDFPIVKEYQLPLPTLSRDDNGDGGPKQSGPPKITKADSIPSAGDNEIQDLPNPVPTNKDLYAGLRRRHARVPESR